LTTVGLLEYWKTPKLLFEAVENNKHRGRNKRKLVWARTAMSWTRRRSCGTF